jgi:hypothetical protein
MADHDANTKRWQWLALFSSRFKRGGVTGDTPTTTNRETGYRDPFVEVRRDRLRKPPPPDDRRYYMRVDATNNLSNTQCKDSVEDLTSSIEQLREGMARISASLPDRTSERISELGSFVDQLGWLIERRIEQVAVLRSCIRKHCPSGLAATILRDSARQAGEPLAAKVAPRCSGEEHVYQVGERAGVASGPNAPPVISGAPSLAN